MAAYLHQAYESCQAFALVVIRAEEVIKREGGQASKVWPAFPLGNRNEVRVNQHVDTTWYPRTLQMIADNCLMGSDV